MLWDDGLRRFEEIDTDEDELAMNDTRMVLKDPVLSAKRRNARQQGRGFVSDELFFNDDFDSGLAYGEDYRSSESPDGGNGGRRSSGRVELSLVPAKASRSRGVDDAVLGRALDRIQRAKEKGKPSVSLTHEELAALERRNSRESNTDRPRSSHHKARERDDSGSSSNNNSPNNGGRNRRKNASSRSGQSSPRQPQKRGKAESRASSASYARDRDDGPRPAHAPVSYYNGRPDRRASGEELRARVPLSRRSDNGPSLRERYSDEPPYPVGQGYRAYNPNMSAPRDRDEPAYRVDTGHRSEGSYRSDGLPESADYYDRARAPYPMPESVARYEIPSGDGLGLGGGLPPAARQSYPQAYSNSSRRVVSGPAETSYSNVIRRVPVAASLARTRVAGSDPSLDRRGGPAADDDSGGDDYSDPEDEYGWDRRDDTRRRSPSGTPPTNGVGRTRSGSVGWQRRKR